MHNHEDLTQATPDAAQEDTANSVEHSLVQIDAIQARVLGCLMEKEVTTPDYYPLSLNSLTTACNQKSNRDPKMEVDEPTVLDALASLSKKSLVMEKGSTGRTQKFVHRAARILQLDNQEQGILCELLIRGPQSPGQLKTRCARLSDYADAEEVELLLTGLAERDAPMVVELPKQSGKRDLRWAHLLSGPVDLGALQGAIASTGGSTVVKVSATETSQRLDQLEAEVATLKAMIQEKLGVDLDKDD